MGSIWIIAWVAACVIAGVAWVRVRLELGRRLRRDAALTDADVRAIIETGVLAPEDEPLDISRVEEEERRFWEQEWDEVEEW